MAACHLVEQSAQFRVVVEQIFIKAEGHFHAKVLVGFASKLDILASASKALPYGSDEDPE
jgi:hypothetical protein